MSSRKDRMDAFGAVALVLQSASLGLNQVMIKLVNVALSPAFQAGLRSVCAVGLVYLVARLRGRRLGFSDGSFWPGMLAGLFFAAEFFLLFTALDYTTVSRASILFYTMPFWTAIFAHFLFPGERLTALKLLGLGLALGGVALAMSARGGDAETSSNQLLGDLACLLGATLWAGIALLARGSNLKNATPEMQLIYQLLVSAPVLMLIAFMIGDVMREPTFGLWLVFAAQVIFVVAIGFSVWFWLLSIYPTADVAVFAFLAPVFGVLFGWWILDEAVGWSILLALLLVAIGIVLVNWKPRQKSKP